MPKSVFVSPIEGAALERELVMTSGSPPGPAMGPHDLIDRRRLRAKLGFWRLLALALLALGVAAYPLWMTISGADGIQVARETIARVEISGLITQDRDLLALLEDLGEEAGVRGVVVAINSPGGTTTGGETLYQAVRDLAAVKPVAVQIETLGASAGYMVASAADHIVAHQSSIVGSIGVIFQYVDASGLLGRVGVDVNAVRSSPLKAEPSPFAPAPPEALEMIGRLVASSYDWFVDLVAERRGFTPGEARALADGSIFTGIQSLDNGLVDALGGEAEVRRWLEEERDVPPGLDIVEREPDRDTGPFSFLRGGRAMLFSLVGLDPQASSLADALRRETGHLDGLLSLWQPSSGENR